MPKSQRNFLEVLDDDISKNNSVGNEIHIVGDFNISLLLNGFDTVGKKKNIWNSKSIPGGAKSLPEFWTFFRSKQ